MIRTSDGSGRGLDCSPSSLLPLDDSLSEGVAISESLIIHVGSIIGTGSD